MRLVLILALALAATPLAAQTPDAPRPGRISVSGEGMAAGAPDLAVISTGVVTEAKSAREALTANTEAMSRLIESLKAAGIEPRDIQTSGFSVQPRYVYPQPRNGEPQQPRITGYEVRNNVTLRVRDLAKLGAVLDSAVTEGSNQIGGLSFDISNKDELLKEARRKALADARAKAELYAAEAGVKLGRLRDLSEQSGFVPPPRPLAMRMEAAAAPQKDVPVEGGEQEIRVNVSVVWEIEP